MFADGTKPFCALDPRQPRAKCSETNSVPSPGASAKQLFRHPRFCAQALLLATRIILSRSRPHFVASASPRRNFFSLTTLKFAPSLLHLPSSAEFPHDASSDHLVRFSPIIVRKFFTATLDHLGLVVIAMLIAILIGVPLVMFIVATSGAARHRPGDCQHFQTIPSLARLAF